MQWLKRTIEAERRKLERARRRFVRKPCEGRLHDVRTTGRRLRSLLEDVRGCEPQPKLLRRVKRAGACTDAARDAAVLAALLANSVGEGERAVVEPLLRELREKERSATQEACRRLSRLTFS
jgi:CHAD domain-containing protein